MEEGQGYLQIWRITKQAICFNHLKWGRIHVTWNLADLLFKFKCSTIKNKVAQGICFLWGFLESIWNQISASPLISNEPNALWCSMHSARGRSEQAHWGIEWKFFTDGISKHISDSSQVTKKKEAKTFYYRRMWAWALSHFSC